MESNSNPTSEDKIWAALAHASVLFSFWGPVVPAVLWFLQRRKSAHVRFHALQALSYQILSIWVYIVLMPLMMIAMFAVMVLSISYAETNNSDPAGLVGAMLPLLIYIPILGLWLLYVLVGLVGAVASLTGRVFHYPFIGRPLQRMLGYVPAGEGSILEQQEDYVAAAVSHATCIIPVLGGILPLIMWITQKDRGGIIRFQSLQALVYQGLGAAAYIAFMAAYMISMFGMMGVFFMGPGGFENPSPESVIGILALQIPLICVGAVFLIGGPLFHLFGFIASLRVLRGNDYNYPLLGRYLRKRTGSADAEAAS